MQINGETNKCYEGSGLGLAIVKSLIELHNGRIYFNSKVGVGTEFNIEIPTNLKIKDENLKDKVYKFDLYDNLEKLNIEFWDVNKDCM